MTLAIPQAIAVCREHYREHSHDHGCPACPIARVCGDVRAKHHKSFADWQVRVEPAAEEVLRRVS